MATIVSVGSGKGGVGKSVISSNLALLFSRMGKRVILVDLDISGANLHVMFGMHHPPATLTDFITGRVNSLEGVAQEVEWGSGLRFIPGTGETLATANLLFDKKKRVVRHLRQMQADLIVLECAPGTSYQALDFFLVGDIQLVVATPDPPSVVELYRFIKLAAILKVLMICLARGQTELKAILMENEFDSVQEILDTIGRVDKASQEKAEEVLREFNPLFVLNQIADKTKLSIAYLQQVIFKFIGSELVLLGEIPKDEAVDQSIRIFQPVVDLASKSPAAKALIQTFHSLQRRLGDRIPALT